MRTEYIGRDIRENELIKTYQDEILFYGCYFDGHWISEINCKKISFIGCYFNGETELSKALFEEVFFENCFFYEPLEIHLNDNTTNWEDSITVKDDSDCKIIIYKGGKLITEKKSEVLPHKFKDFVSLRHYEADNVYHELKQIHNYYIKNKNIDCLPIFSGLITDAYNVVKRDTIQYLLSYGVNSTWHKHIMQVVFNWIYDQDVINDISFVRNAKSINEWHIPSFSRIFSSNWFDVVDGLKSILRCFKYNSSLLEESFYEKIKHLALHSEEISIVGRCIQIISMKEKNLLELILEKRLQLIKKIKDPEVLALLEALDENR